MKKGVIFVLILSISGICFSQSLSRNEFVNLAYKIESFVSKKDSLYDANRTSQFIYILANINSSGRIDKIDLSGIKSDTIFQILDDLKPADMADWKCASCKSKTIVIPLFYVSASDSTDKIEQMLLTHYLKIPHKEMITEVGNTILVRYMFFNSRQKPREGFRTSEYKVVRQ
jgi:hypothetical protein